MDLKALFPIPSTKRPISQGSAGWRHPYHSLLSTQGLNRIRNLLSIADWLLVGCCIQGLIILLTPRSIPTYYALTPTFGLAIFKVVRCVLVCFGVLENQLMRGVLSGRSTAIFPEADGGSVRSAGKSIGGGKIVVVLLTSKSNHPLGMLHTPYLELSAHGRAMYIQLEKSAHELGFLGYSDYSSNSTSTHPSNLSLMYFRSMEHLYAFAHGDVHRKGWDWWNKASAEGRLGEVSIGHEVYEVDEGKWENVKWNSQKTDFAATSHAIQTAGGERKWVCPVMDANKGFKTSKGRMGTVQG